MDLGITNRVAMVAAASKGIGLAVATALAKEGCQVSICSRDAAALEAARRRSWRRRRAPRCASFRAT